MNSSAYGLNPYDSSLPAEALARPVVLEERVLWLDIAEGTFYGFAMSPIVGAIAGLMLFAQVQSDGYREYIDHFYNSQSSLTAAGVAVQMVRTGVLTAVGACLLLGALAGLLIALQPRLTHRGLLWQLALPALIVATLATEYIMLMGWWPFVGTDIPGDLHLLLASGPAAVLLLAGLGSLSSYKLAGRPHYFDTEAANHGMNAELVLASWLRRKWRVSLPEGEYVVDYCPMSLWERVYVDGHLVCQQWSMSAVVVPRFDFVVGNQSATIEVRVWPWLTTRWLTLKVSGQVVYGEGTPL